MKTKKIARQVLINEISSLMKSDQLSETNYAFLFDSLMWATQDVRSSRSVVFRRLCQRISLAIDCKLTKHQISSIWSSPLTKVSDKFLIDFYIKSFVQARKSSKRLIASKSTVST